MTRHGASGAETQTMHTSVLVRAPPAAAARLQIFIQTLALPGIFQHRQMAAPLPPPLTPSPNLL